MVSQVWPASPKGDVIAGEDDGVGREAVDAIDNAAKEERLSELVKMNLAELGYAHAVEGAGKAGQEEVVPSDLEPVAFDVAGVEGESRRAAETCLQKTPPGNRRLPGRADNGHGLL